jgi:Sortilin, neurotensin receptor 3,
MGNRTVVLLAFALSVACARKPGSGGPEPSESSPPEDWFVMQRLYGQGVPPGALARAARQAAAIDRLAVKGGIFSGTWTFVGPTNIGGRVLDIAVDPTQADTLYVATASGGVWKSVDAGRSFSVAWPDEASQAIGALAIAPDGTLYAGTGETGPGGGSLTYGGTGLYQSTDGAQTWNRVGLEDVSRIARIAIDPSDPARIFAAVSGDLFLPGGQRGVYRSQDGGNTWERVLAGDTQTTGAADLVIDPQDPSRIFVTLWDHRRAPAGRTYSGIGSGVYFSSDGGDRWTRLTNGLPSTSPMIGRIGIAVAPSDPLRVYVITTQSTPRFPSDGLFEGFYVSADGGASFTRQAPDSILSQSQASYGWWFGRIWVDPSDADSVWVAGVNLVHSRGAGRGWDGNPAGHADQHAMAWDPYLAGRVYVGNDGGVFTSLDNGSTWTRGAHQPWTQFYTVDVSRSDPSRIVGGAQDNGVNRSYRGTGGGDPDAWNSFVGGDGLAARIDPTNQYKVYGCAQYGSCGRSMDGGDSLLLFGPTSSQRRNWLSPVEFDPTDPSVMYYAGNILNRSTNSAVTWTPISPDLTGGPSSFDGYPFGTITTVAAASTDSSVLYVGTDDGRVWTTRDLGSSWLRLEDPQFPTAWVTRVAVDPADADIAYVAFSGFRAGNQQGYLFRTTDGGLTWQDITSNLPLAPLNDVLIVNSSLLVASDLGVFATDDGGAAWYRAGNGLPQTPVTDLAFSAFAGKIFASTFGRGMYSLEILPSG